MKSEEIKAKRFNYQQIRKQEKSNESEDFFSSYEGNALLEKKKQANFIKLEIYCSKYLKQLRSILTQYEVLKEELDQLKTLLLTNKHITREQKLLQSQKHHVKQYQCRQKTLNISIHFLKSNNNKLPQFERIKIKEFLKDQKKLKNSLSRDKKSKQSEKDADIVNKNSTQLETAKALKTSSKRRKNVKTVLKTLNNKIRNLQEENILGSKIRERASWINFLAKKIVEPYHVKFDGLPQSG